MATLLKRTQITRYAPNFGDMQFMVIVMASPRGFLDFILEAEKYAKKLPINGHFCALKFLKFFADISGLKQKLRNRLGDALSISQSHNSKPFEGMLELTSNHKVGCHRFRPSSPSIMGPSLCYGVFALFLIITVICIYPILISYICI